MEELIERDELKRLEQLVDDWRSSIPLPAWGRQLAQWSLLSVTEDELRIRMLKVQGGTLDLDQYNQWIDVHKYMLKYALAYVEQLAPQALTNRPPIENEDWGRAHELLEAHATYDHAVAAFSGAYAGALRCLRQDDGSYWFRSTGSFERQANDLLESRTEATSGSPVGVLIDLLFSADQDLPPALRACTQRTRRGAPELKPRLNADALDEVAEMLGEGRNVLPADWVSPLGTGVQLTQSLRNLTLAAVAHVTAVSCASVGQPGIGVQWLLGEATASCLVRLMTSRGGVDTAAARQIVDLLIYGNHVRTPDPALQFLFPLREGLIAVPWFLYATCNVERNLLALLARARPDDFDAASHAFERGMIRELREAIMEPTWKARLNRRLPREERAGEVDAVLLDPIGRFAFVCELRWFLEPSEVGEVAAREAEGPRKVQQLEAKMAALSRVIETVLHEESIPVEGEWQIDGAAVFHHHTPVPPETTNVPLVSHRAFLAGIRGHARLRDLAGWLRNGEWLPRRDEHFTTDPTEVEIAGLRIKVDGINPTSNGYRFVLERDDRPA